LAFDPTKQPNTLPRGPSNLQRTGPPPERNQSRCVPEARPQSGFLPQKKAAVETLKKGKVTLVPL